MEIKNLQLHVARQVIIRHSCYFIKGKIKTQGTACYSGNTGESTVGAVTEELLVAVVAGWLLVVCVQPLAPALREEEEDEDEGESRGAAGWTSHAA